jgi:hypothetical protein
MLVPANRAVSGITSNYEIIELGVFVSNDLIDHPGGVA